MIVSDVWDIFPSAKFLMFLSSDPADIFKNTVHAKRLNDLVVKLPHVINALFLTALDPELVIPSV